MDQPINQTSEEALPIPEFTSAGIDKAQCPPANTIALENITVVSDINPVVDMLNKIAPAPLPPSLDTEWKSELVTSTGLEHHSDEYAKRVPEDSHSSILQGSRFPSEEIAKMDDVELRPKSFEGATTMKSSIPSYISFPNAFDDDGRRMPAKEMFAQPQKDILPPSGDPLWRQMLTYCQRWAVWAATVNDDKRRSELLDWVTKKMEDSWKFGISNGHCGEPNGHQSCCLAHASVRTQQQKEVRKRPVDPSRQPAPFACEGVRHAYSITNRELKQAGVTMDTILERAASDNQNVGTKLLDGICEALGRSELEPKDWTIINRYAKFNPLVNTRNLLMFCLWEVQRCRTVVNGSVALLEKANTVNQQKLFQKRIDVHRERADQHLALALELDEQRSNESDNQGDSEQVKTRQERVSRSSKRQTRAASSVEVTSHGESEQHEASPNTTKNSVVQATSIDNAERLPEDVPQRPNSRLNDLNTRPALLTRETSQDLGYDPQPGVIALSSKSGIKRDCPEIITDNERSQKRFKSDHINSVDTDDEFTQFCSDTENSNDSHSTHAPEDAFDAEHQQDMNNIDTVWQPYDRNVNPQQIAYPIHLNSENTKPAAPATADSPDITRKKQQYVLQCWQPRINELLTKRGYGSLKWNLSGWADIRDILGQLEFNAEGRNKMLREFKTNFAEWETSTAQTSSQNLPTSAPAEPSTMTSLQTNPNTCAPTSSSQLNSSKGFFFRYFNSTTKAERDRVDDMVHEYVSFIMRGRVARYGFYVVFFRLKDPTQKELAHGFWNQRANKPIPDAAWFYSNEIRPANFRSGEQLMYHDWGCSVGPPKHRNSIASKRQKTRVCDSVRTKSTKPSHSVMQARRAVSNKTDLSPFTTQQEGGVKANTGSRRRRVATYNSDSDSDVEWHPEDD